MPAVKNRAWCVTPVDMFILAKLEAEGLKPSPEADRTTLIRILLPNIRPSLVTGTVLCFAHTIGEFGVVMMIGGSIPGQTRVASVAIYDEVQSINYSLANQYAIVLLAFSFLILLLVYLVNHQFNHTKTLP